MAKIVIAKISMNSLKTPSKFNKEEQTTLQFSRRQPKIDLTSATYLKTTASRP